MTRKTIALIQGDPAGIGPELMARLLSDADVRAAANLVVIGAPEIFARGEEQHGESIENVRHVDFDADIDVREGEVLHLDMQIDGLGKAR